MVSKISRWGPLLLLSLLAIAFHFDPKSRSPLAQELFQYDTYLPIVAYTKEDAITYENSTLSERFDVLNVWSKYKREHSHFALIEETATSNAAERQFAVGYYSCPLQAGNRLHHFMNNLIWAVVTNRTLLWKYYDTETCQNVGKKHARNICMAANNVEDCDNVLTRAKWLPSLDEWYAVLNLTTPLSLSYWTTHDPSTTNKYWFEGAESEAGLADSTGSRLIDFPQMLGQDSSILHSERKRKKLLTSGEAQRRAELLFRAGADYLYGLLFFDSFTFQPSVSVPVVRDFDSRNRTKGLPQYYLSGGIGNNVTVVVHSRHSKVDDDGATIKREARCLDQVLNQTSGFCQVMILSDRPRTLIAVAEYLNHNYPRCHPLVAPHEIGSSFVKEHGPFSGSGFYQDLAMVSNQTLHVPTSITAFIGSKHRSSSQLVREIMTFQHQQQAARNFPSPELATCYLEEVE